MPNYRITNPMITWGAGGTFANTLRIGYLLDNLKAGSVQRPGSAFDQTPSGIEDAWTVGFDYYLEAELRWIPQNDTATPLATGWDGTLGVRAFLEFARDKNPFRWYPDQTDAGTLILSYLADPMQGYGDAEPSGQRRLPLKIRNASTPYSGY